MVALNESFAPENPTLGSENRVGNFFAEKGKLRRVNRLSTQNSRREKAHAYDETASGMYYYGFRYYDAETGRWLSRDPTYEILGKHSELLPEGPSAYAFLGNNPNGGVDYLGLYLTTEPDSNGNNKIRDTKTGKFGSKKALIQQIKNSDAKTLSGLRKINATASDYAKVIGRLGAKATSGALDPSATIEDFILAAPAVITEVVAFALYAKALECQCHYASTPTSRGAIACDKVYENSRTLLQLAGQLADAGKF